MSDQPKDLRKLCILNMKETESDDKVREICEKFGRLVKFHRPSNNNRLAFPLFLDEKDAQCAKDGLIEAGYRVEFANSKRENPSEDGVRSNEFRSTRNSQTLHTIENGFVEADSTVQMANRPYGHCLKCGDKAYFNCGRCGDFYCSEGCQQIDWLAHKRICFPMPKLVPAKSTYSLHAGRTNSVETVKLSKEKCQDVDDADGQQNTSPKPETGAIRKQSVTLNGVLNSHSKPERSLVEEVEVAHRTIQSPRARLLSQTNGDSSGKPSASPVKGLITDPIPNGSEVFITYVKSHRSIYIRSALTDIEYKKLITRVEDASNKAPKLSVYPSRDDIVMAPYDGAYYRAIVIKSDKSNDMVKVAFIDFGNPCEVLFNQLKELPIDLKQHRRLVFNVGLKNIENEYEVNEMTAMQQHLEVLCENGTIIKANGDKDLISPKDQIELFDIITNQSINDMLIGMAKKHWYLDDLSKKIVKGSDLSLMIIGSESIKENLVGCILSSDVTKFMEDDQKTQDFGEAKKKAPAYKPKHKELCLVKIKEVEGDIWYRAQYQQELIDDKAQVYCFDYGRIEIVRASNIRSIDADITHEILSFVARLEDGDKLSPEEKQNLTSEPFTVKAVDYDGDLHIIKLA